jgi:siroheme synthase (precorrin-2 oxidase/ferrochelatase)
MGAVLCVAHAAEPGVRSTIAADARAAGVLVNVMDDVPNCDFAAPAIVRRGDLVIAIGTGGRAPALASRLRAELGGHGLVLDGLRHVAQVALRREDDEEEREPAADRRPGRARAQSADSAVSLLLPRGAGVSEDLRQTPAQDDKKASRATAVSSFICLTASSR